MEDRKKREVPSKISRYTAHGLHRNSLRGRLLLHSLTDERWMATFACDGSSCRSERTRERDLGLVRQAGPSSAGNST